MGDKYIIKEGIPKYCSFHYPELEEILKLKSVSKNVVVDSLKSLKTQFDTLTNELKNLVDSNLNSFNSQSKLYNRKTYHYLILSKIDLELSEIMIYKLSEEEKYVFDKNKIIKEIKDNITDKEELSLFLKRVEFLLNNSENIYNSNLNFGLTFVNVLINYTICYMKEVLNQIKLFKERKINKDYSMDDEIILIDLIFMLEKLDSFYIFLGWGFYVGENDLFNQDEDSPDWKSLSKITYEVIFSRENEIQTEFRKGALESERIIGTILNSYDENSYRIRNGLTFLYNFFYRYGRDYKLMLYESKKAQLIQHKNVTKEIMSVVLWPTFKKLGERDYPKINFRKKMYVKKEYPDITLENIQNLLKLMGNKSIDVSNINQEIIYKNESDIINNKEISKDELYRDKVPKNIKKYFVSTTILHSSYITFPEEKKTLKYSIMNSFFEYNKPNETKDALMIFIHGGGFVGMSTQFHESFLREWVNALNIPFIGINYGLSPMHKYPYGLNDCYQAYRWIINHCEEIIGIKPKKLILAGDSSGATFVLSLTFLLIAKNEFENANIRLPDLILPLYPCCNTSYKNMSLSLIITVKDFLLNDKFLLYVNDAYRDIYPNDDDPFLNPAQAKECILKKLPKSIWHFGNCDPLRDDIVRLLAKISKIKEVDIKAYEFREYNHGWNGGVKNEFIVKTPKNMIFKEIRDMIK